LREKYRETGISGQNRSIDSNLPPNYDPGPACRKDRIWFPNHPLPVFFVIRLFLLGKYPLSHIEYHSIIMYIMNDSTFQAAFFKQMIPITLLFFLTGIIGGR
jgi:hypothetical protein